MIAIRKVDFEETGMGAEDQRRRWGRDWRANKND